MSFNPFQAVMCADMSFDESDQGDIVDLCYSAIQQGATSATATDEDDAYALTHAAA